MAHYDAHEQKNRGYYDGYGIREPQYMVGYSATSESYVSSTEHVYQLGSYRPTQAQVWPPTLIHPQSKKGDGYDHAPNFSHDSPRKTHQRRYGSPHKGDGYDHAPNFNHGSPRKTHQPMYGSPHKGDGYDHVPNFNHGSPRKNHQRIYGSPHDSPRKIDDSSGDEDDVECRNGVCYPKPKHGGEKKKEKGYGGNYPLVQPVDHHDARKDSYGPRNYYNTGKQQPEVKDYYGPNSNSYYDSVAPQNDLKSSSIVNLPAPIKTRPDHHSPVTHFAGSPRKDYHGKQDFTNSPGRNGNLITQWTPFGGKDYEGKQGNQSTHHKPTIIDSETVAKRYGGVFVK